MDHGSLEPITIQLLPHASHDLQVEGMDIDAAWKRQH